MGRRNVEHTLGAVFRLGQEELEKITPEDWQNAIKLATKSEQHYALIDGIIPSPEEQNSGPMPQDMEEEIPTEEIQPEPDQNPFLCSICHVDFKGSKAFTNHTKKYAKCSACPKMFCGAQRENNLKGHFKKEHNIKPQNAHFCPICKKAFEFPSRVKKHLTWSACGRQELPKN